MWRVLVVGLALGLGGCGGTNQALATHPIPAGPTTALRKPQVVEQNTGAQIIRFAIPSAGARPFRIIANGANFWFSEQGQAAVASITPSGVVTQYPLGAGGLGAGSTQSLVLGPDKNVWFTAGATIAHTLGSAPVVQFSLPVPANISNAALPCANGIAAGSDGAIWFTDACNSAVGRIPTTGTPITEYPLPTPSAAPLDIVVGPDKNLWVTEAGAGKLARVVPASAAITEFALPQSGLAPAFITNANDALWFTLSNFAGVGTMTSAGKTTLIPGADIFTGITKGPDNNVWMSDFNAQSFAIVTAAKLYATPIPIGTQAAGLITGSDKNLWFTDASNDSIDVYVTSPQTVSATSIAFNLIGETQLFTATEPGYSGTPLTASSSNTKVATVALSALGQWTVTAVAAGNCTITVRDQYANSTTINISVTTETFVIQ